ncbi:MAG TPA: ADOP family duplicated permease [Gemmatimonadaceae bacterium]|jgi:predicted permease
MTERQRIERETDDEIRAHLVNRVDDLVARGMPRHQAEDEALRRFGPLDSSRAELFAAARHRERVLTMYDRFDALVHDVRYALRQIRRAPLLAITVIVTFALGVGANATMFGLLDRLLLRPPAYVRSPEQVVRVRYEVRRPNRESFTNSSSSYPMYVALRDHVAGFENVALQTYPNPVSFGLGAGAHAVQQILISGNYFSTLGVPMAMGRPILPSDDILPDGSPVVVIGYGLWQRELGGDPNIIGKAVNLAGRQYTVVGVAPRDFISTQTRKIDVWIPVSAANGLRFAGANWATDRGSTWMTLVARLRPGISSTVAGAQVAAAVRAFHDERGGHDTATFALPQVSILPRNQDKLNTDSRVAVVLGAVSILVLLIACANVANLLLARALRRRREIAVRLALGVSRSRLVRQLTIEGLVLAIFGGAAALVVVQVGGAFMYRTLLSDYAQPASFIDLRVLLFTVIATLGVGFATSVIPAVQASRSNLSRDLKEGTRGAGLSHSRTRTTLLLVQAALSVVLLTGTATFVLSLRKVNAVNLGLDLDRLLLGRIDLRSVGIDSLRSLQYFNDVVGAIGRLPGVEYAAVAEATPFSDWTTGFSAKTPGRDSLPNFDDGPMRAGVGVDYFRASGTRVLRGRGFEAIDYLQNAEPVIVLNDAAARKIWPTEDAIGKCIELSDKDPTCFRIVGIAQDTHHSAVVEKGSNMMVYNPVGHSPRFEPRAFALVVRAKGDPATIVESVRRTMQTVYAGLPFANVVPMESSLDTELRPWRLGSTLFGVFGAIALALSALGLYSVVGYSVAQRTHEMGVRVALGAQVRDIIQLVLAQGVGVAAAGVALGILLTLAGGGLVSSLLYQTSARNPLVIGSVAMLLLFVATLASLMPALRATRADPLTALRAE